MRRAFWRYSFFGTLAILLAGLGALFLPSAQGPPRAARLGPARRPHHPWQSYSHAAQMPGAGTPIYTTIGWHGPGSTTSYPKAVDVDCVSVTLP